MIIRNLISFGNNNISYSNNDEKVNKADNTEKTEIQKYSDDQLKILSKFIAKENLADELESDRKKKRIIGDILTTIFLSTAYTYFSRNHDNIENLSKVIGKFGKTATALGLCVAISEIFDNIIRNNTIKKVQNNPEMYSKEEIKREKNKYLGFSFVNLIGTLGLTLLGCYLGGKGLSKLNDKTKWFTKAGEKIDKQKINKAYKSLLNKHTKFDSNHPYISSFLDITGTVIGGTLFIGLFNSFINNKSKQKINNEEQKIYSELKTKEYAEQNKLVNNYV